MWHTYVDGVCSRCRTIIPHIHSYTTTSTAAATCTEAGYEIQECACGDTQTVTTTEALGHDYVDDVCSRCGDILGHTHAYTTEVEVVAATCTKEGYTLMSCSCGATTKTNIVAALGHKVLVNRCTRCHALIPTNPPSILSQGTGDLGQSTVQSATGTAGTNGTSETTAAADPILVSTVTDTYSYIYNGGSLSQLVISTATTIDEATTTATQTLNFAYDASGTPMAVIYNGTTYYYATNLQGDVTAILNSTGTAVVTYTYNAWGNLLTTTGTLADTLGKHNPLRYRGYVYDQETGLYYLQSRYYEPELGRFINADAFTSTGQGILGNNTFSYCGNNPVIRADTGGYFWDIVLDVVSLVISVIEVVQTPDDPIAWLGVAADVASLVIPFVSGGGALVKAATKADDVVDAVKAVDKVDDAVDTVKSGWHVGDDITNLTKAGNTPSWSTVRQRYWKNEAYYHPELYPNDLDRLKRGLAPIGEDGFSMELHHPLGRDGNNYFIFEALTQTQHRWIHYGD